MLRLSRIDSALAQEELADPYYVLAFITSYRVGADKDSKKVLA
jgi:hypothetical protein